MYWLFADLTALAAYWIEADLDIITAPMHAHRPPPRDLGVLPDPIFLGLRYGGVPEEGMEPFLPAQMREQCNDAHTVWFRVRLNPEKVEPMLLPGLTLDSTEGLIMMQRCHPYAVPGDLILPLIFNELWVTVPVRFHGVCYTYPLLLLTGDDVGMIGGQDFGGLPKKMANLTFAMSPPVPAAEQPGYNTSVVCSASRHGRPALNFTGRITTRTSKLTPGVNDNFAGDGARWALIVGHQMPRDPELDSPFYLLPRTMSTTKVQRAMTDMTMEFGSHLQEPLGDWFQGPPLEGGYVKTSKEWLPALGGNIRENFKQVDGDAYAAWWTRNFQVLFM
jgi:hypothetical protein